MSSTEREHVHHKVYTKMKDEIVEVVGKTICGLIESVVDGRYSSVYIFFTDGTHCELFSELGINSSRGLYPSNYEEMHKILSNDKSYVILKEYYVEVKK